MRDIFPKPPSVLGALAGDPFRLQAISAAAAMLPMLAVPRIVETGILAELERSFAPLRDAMRLTETYRRSLASVPKISTFFAMEIER